MKLSDYLAQNDFATKTFAARLNVTDEAVRLWATGGAIPRKNVMADIVEATGGAVQPNDFYDLPTKPETEAIAS